jgi:hypothetical protein
LILKVITSLGSKKLDIEVKRLHDEVLTLTQAIEEAIIKGRKSTGDLYDISDSVLVTREDSTLTYMNEGSGVVGWVDDF